MISRRKLLRRSAALAGATVSGAALAHHGDIPADWETLGSAYAVPDWFRDAKFGFWSHWGVQCVPERGDWYGRQMYIQGNHVYDHHLETYGHPADFGFIEFIGRWRAERWEPASLTEKFRRAGARYVMAMANHHDNLDNFDSAHHRWNTVNLGPKKDIVGIWEKAVREAGLKFGVSNHSSHAWHWWQTAYAYDPEGARRRERYDAFGLTTADGAGKFWDGYDPQQFYTGPSMVAPDGIDSVEAMQQWHWDHDGQWLEMIPPGNEAFAAKWLLRQMDLVEKYDPDIVYLDNYRLPFGQYGLDAVAHYYNRRRARHGGLDAVLTAKRLGAYQREAIVEDVERGFIEDISPVPWQTSTCIGQWHYDRPLYERHGYKSAKSVIQRLADVVSKNGNLLLSIPQRGDGSIDPDEEAILDRLAAWIAINGEAIYGTRPWRRYGEGPARTPSGHMAEGEADAFTARDIRFTAKGGALHAIFLEWPEGEGRIEALGARALPEARIERVTMLDGRPLDHRRTGDALAVALPPPGDGAFVPAIRIAGAGLV